MDPPEPVVSFTDLPREVLWEVLSSLGGHDLIRMGATCGAIRDVVSDSSSQLLWKRACTDEWSSWDAPQWRDCPDWRSAYATRRALDARALKLLRDDNIQKAEMLQSLRALGGDVLEVLTKEAKSFFQKHKSHGQAAVMADHLRMIISEEKLGALVAGGDSAAGAGVAAAAVIEEAAWLVAGVLQPERDMSAARSALDSTGRRLKSMLELSEPMSKRERLEALNTVVFGGEGDAEGEGAGLGLRGNAGSYYDPFNSMIDQVVGRRLGIPITLAIVYAAVARRAGITIEMVGLPCHFMARCPGEGGASGDTADVYIDVFRRGFFMTEDECRDFVASMGIRFHPSMLAPPAPADVITRVCNNLLGIFKGHGGRPEREVVGIVDEPLLVTLSLLVAARPHEREARMRRSVAAFNSGDFHTAERDLEYLLEGEGGPGREVIQGYLRQFREHMAAGGRG